MAWRWFFRWVPFSSRDI
ncbi:hypothetical protein C370_07292 [Cryptococcus neoformans A1-35-8]|nr:hypothetical protein C369_07313 [Cryptococcus neoformans var. grubii A5-35-17]OXH00813.1 hypothetical protein C370_07292 [Cryptococcus neoformans var. grubii A1-35-8]